MKNSFIFYGSREKFSEIVPQNKKTLTEIIYEFDKDSKNLKLLLPTNEGKYPKSNSPKIKINNLVIYSDEYASVREHVITNFINFLSNFDIKNIYIHNPPTQISDQIKRLYPTTKVQYQEYKTITESEILKINDTFDDVIIGQEEVKIQLIQSLYPLTLNTGTKPIVLLFYGKSGIGKTETAQFLSKIIGEPLLRKQFSMFQNNQFSTYLFGGTHYEKSFAKDLLDRKSNLILLDEFDKAHPSFHSAFYQLFDEGIYEDQNYNLTLHKSIIICTSNYTSLEDIEKNLGSAIFNRFDKIIHFSELKVDAKTKIGKKLFDELSSHYDIQLDEDIKQRLIMSYKNCENVRQIKRIIQDTLSLASIYKLSNK